MIEDSIRRFVVEEASTGRSPDPLGDDYPLLDKQVIDSLGLFNLVGHLESEFGVEIQDEELVPGNFGTIGDIARMVREKQG